MRIAYLTEWSPYAETGVLRKLIGQVEAWRCLGNEAALFAIAPRQDITPALDFLNYGAVIGALHQRNLEVNPRMRLGYFNKIASLPALKSSLQRFAPDLIYYRQNGPWYPGLGTVLNLAPTVLEINTDEDVENKFWGRLNFAFHKATKSLTHRRVAGFVCVTRQIAKKYLVHGKPVAVVGNSMWGDPRPLPPSGNARVTFVFVGSRLAGDWNWHGVDKILKLAAKMTDCKFNIVGLTAEDLSGHTIPGNVVMHGEKRGAELEQIYRLSDVGLGSLALHRINLKEACPLKTREYLMYGLPVVIGYKEVEERICHADYILNIGNYENNVSDAVEKIVNFANGWIDRRIGDDLSFLSGRAKAKQRLDFLAEVLAAKDGKKQSHL
jgi:hypothetical protein